MTATTSMIDAAGDPDETRVVSLYKISIGQGFADCWRPPNEEEADNYTTQAVDDIGDEALLVIGRKNPKQPDWLTMIRDLTGIDLDFENAEPAAVLFVRNGKDAFALTYGAGWRLLKGNAIDRDFGIEFALRAIDADEVRHLKRQYFNAKSRVDINVVPGGQALWSFGIREHAELVRQISGKVLPAGRLNISHVRKMAKKQNARISLDCTDKIRVPLPHSTAHLTADIREISRVLATFNIDEELESLRWIRRLNSHEEEGLKEAWETLFDLFDSYDDSVSLAYPARYHGGPEISRFMGQIGAHVINETELALEDIRTGVAGRTVEGRILALKNGYIEGYDDAGTTLGGGESALHWISGQVDLGDGRRLVLLDGDWYDLTDKYRQFVDRIVAEAFKNGPTWSLPAWNLAPTGENGRREEKDYNKYVGGTNDGFLCLDRKLVRTRMHRHGFEACDLLGPAQELVHVKKVSSRTGSGPLSHLFAQGIVTIESLTDKEIWGRFVELVGNQDPDRAEKLGSRPHALIYAIHRSDGLLTPDRLFTFAKAELASAAILFSKLGIPLQICVIP